MARSRVVCPFPQHFPYTTTILSVLARRVEAPTMTSSTGSWTTSTYRSFHSERQDLPQRFVTHTVVSRRVGVVPRAGAPRGTAESYVCTSRGPTAPLG